MFCKLTTLFLFGSLALFAADQPKTAPPTLNKDKVIEIQSLQIQNQQLVIRMQQMQQDFSNLQKQNNDLAAKIESEEEQAQNSVDPSKKNWLLNPATLKFEPAHK